MITLRKSKDRGYADHDWLKSYHTFSFADYYDVAHMGHSVLRVINDDTIDAGTGFPMHSHRDMEIITYVYKGAIEHRDSLGNVGRIRHGEIQRMSAGSGIRHSEYNPNSDEETQLLQIWILPDRQGYTPGYEQVDLTEKFKSESWVLISSQNGENNSTTINQNAKIFAGNFVQSTKFKIPICKSRKGWLQMVSGSVTVQGLTLNPGDGIALENEESPELTIEKQAHFLFFDLP